MFYTSTKKFRHQPLADRIPSFKQHERTRSQGMRLLRDYNAKCEMESNTTNWTTLSYLGPSKESTLRSAGSWRGQVRDRQTPSYYRCLCPANGGLDRTTTTGLHHYNQAPPQSSHSSISWNAWWSSNSSASGTDATLPNLSLVVDEPPWSPPTICTIIVSMKTHYVYLDTEIPAHSQCAPPMHCNLLEVTRKVLATY